MPDAFQKPYQVVLGIRNKLEKLSLTQAWSLRETDLYDYQRQLDRIDESRKDGNFHDVEGNPAELYVQRVGRDEGLYEPLLTLADTPLFDKTKLRIHLLPDGLIRTGLRSPPPCLQPTPNSSTLSYRSKELRWSQLAQGAVPLQHEAQFY